MHLPQIAALPMAVEDPPDTGRVAPAAAEGDGFQLVFSGQRRPRDTCDARPCLRQTLPSRRRSTRASPVLSGLAECARVCRPRVQFGGRRRTGLCRARAGTGRGQGPGRYRRAWAKPPRSGSRTGCAPRTGAATDVDAVAPRERIPLAPMRVGFTRGRARRRWRLRGARCHRGIGRIRGPGARTLGPGRMPARDRVHAWTVGVGAGRRRCADPMPRPAARWKSAPRQGPTDLGGARSDATRDSSARRVPCADRAAVRGR